MSLDVNLVFTKKLNVVKVLALLIVVIVVVIVKHPRSVLLSST